MTFFFAPSNEKGDGLLPTSFFLPSPSLLPFSLESKGVAFFLLPCFFSLEGEGDGLLSAPQKERGIAILFLRREKGLPYLFSFKQMGSLSP